MLTELARDLTTDGDTVILFLTDESWSLPIYGERPVEPFDGHTRRYVFCVEGRGATGFGRVGAGVDWRADLGGSSTRVDPFHSRAVASIEPYADACTFSDDYEPITVRGAIYGYGYAWKRNSYTGDWQIRHAGLTRENGATTDAGQARVSRILQTARDLFLALPGAERETVRRSLQNAQKRQAEFAEQAACNIERLATMLGKL